MTQDNVTEPDNLSPYIKRIVEAIDYNGFDDREDVRSILKEIISSAEHQARVDALYEAADLVRDDIEAYFKLIKRRDEVLSK